MKYLEMPVDDIEGQAVAWLTRMDRDLSDSEEAEFEQWRSADLRHEIAFAKIASTWSAFDRPVATGQVDSLRAELFALERRDRRRWMAAGSAAILAAAACLTVFIGLRQPAVSPATMSGGESAGRMVARVVEPERQILPDGSLVELKHGAKIKVAFTEASRIVILEEGEAHFTVTKNHDRPFIVETGSVKVCAVGTAFAVGLVPGEVDVLVTEGRVRVDSAADAARDRSDPSLADPSALFDHSAGPLVESGHRAVVTLGKVDVPTLVAPISASDLTERLSWRLPRLEFSETSLREAVSMFNRYNPDSLRVEGESVAAMRITGIYRSDNVEGFVRALELGLGLRAEHRGNETVLYRGK